MWFGRWLVTRVTWVSQRVSALGCREVGFNCVSSGEGKRTERLFPEKLFVTLVTEVSLISREPNLRFERISISRRFLWKSFSSFPFYTRHDWRRGLVTGYPKLVSFGPRPLFDSVRHFIVKHISFESVITLLLHTHLRSSIFKMP
jgi:hypothetical protein